MPQLFTSAFIIQSRHFAIGFKNQPEPLLFKCLHSFHHLVLFTRTVVFEIKVAATSTSLEAATFRMNGGFQSLECGHFLSH
jgi:hypothetical protein